MRKKNCANCKKEFDVMYRAQYQAQRDWVFLCKNCLLSVKHENPFYRYGGTWKK
jgi:predicted amidophosphoribosyltransferase